MWSSHRQRMKRIKCLVRQGRNQFYSCVYVNSLVPTPRYPILHQEDANMNVINMTYLTFAYSSFFTVFTPRVLPLIFDWFQAFLHTSYSSSFPPSAQMVQPSRILAHFAIGESRTSERSWPIGLSGRRAGHSSVTP